MRRKTSSLERFMLFFGRQYPLNFGFKVTVGGLLGEARAREALVTLAARHPLLYAHQEYTIGKQMDMIFDGVPTLLVSTIDDRDREWQDLLLTRMGRAFDPFTGPLFSLDLRPVGSKTELLFVFQHGAADGIAAVYFIHDFLRVVGGLSVEIPDEPAMPVLYDVLEEDVARELSTRPEPDWKKETPPEPKPFNMPPYAVPDFYLRTFELSEEGTARLAAAAKAGGHTVHSYLGALLMKASADIFGAEGGMDRVIQCPVDFRQYLKPEYRAIAGVYNGIVKVKLDCAAPVSEMAKTIKDGIQGFRAGMKDIEEYFHFRDSFDNVPDPESFMMGFPPDVLDYDFSFSNLGKTIVERVYGSLLVEDLYGPIFTAVNKETVIGLNTTNGSLRMSLIFDRTIPKATGYERLGDEIGRTLAGFEATR